MLRILFFLVIVVAIGSALAALAAQSGEVVLIVAEHRIVLPLFTAVCAVAVVVFAFLTFWWLVKTLIHAPQTLRNHLDDRRERRGYRALSQGLIATMSGDIRTAQRLTKQAQTLLRVDQEPLVPLLAAETKRLELDYQGAVSIFHSMCEDPQTQMIGLKGLYREAMREGDDALAGHYARQALALDGALEWAIRASVTQYALTQSWDEALELLDRYDLAIRKSRRKIKNKDMEHWRTVLLSAKACDDLAEKPEAAREEALRAHKLAPDFIPAAIIAAKSLATLGERKKAEKLIENFWHKNPHPDLGQIYLEIQTDVSKEETLRRAMQLEQQNPDSPVSQLLVARAALQVGNLDKARHYGEKLASQTPCESIFLLLADVHGALGADEGTIRHYLTQAMQAPADPAWVADGQIMTQWVAISPLSHRIGGCEWRQPAKHFPPLLALPKVETESDPAPSHQDPAATTKITLAQDDAAIQKSKTPSEMQEMQTPAIFLTAEKNQKKTSRTKRTNGTTFPPTRIIVDDPGILENEDQP